LRCAIAALAASLALAPALHAKTLRHASQVDPGTMDPHSMPSLYNNRVLSQVYEHLVGRDGAFRPAPQLALSWTPLDGGTGWRFKLRPGVKFHDGTPFTAEDAAFTVKRALEPTSAYRTALPNVTGAKAVDPLTVDIFTRQPTPVLPAALTNLRVMSKAWCEKHRVEKPQDFKAKEETYAARNANGTGAFRLARWETDVKTVLVANPGYWGPRGNVTEAHYLVIGSAATRVAGLVSGEIDIVVDPAVQDVERLRKQAGIRVEQATGLGVNFLGFHHQRADLGDGSGRNPFKDLRVRQAVRAAIDVPALRSKVMRGTATSQLALYSSAVAGFDPRLKDPAPHDLARAKALLKEAGYAGGFAVDLDCSAQQPTDTLCQAIAGMLARVGIRVNYRPAPFNTFLPRLTAGEMNLYVVGWTAATADPEGALVPLARTRANGLGEYNFGAYSNPRADEAIDKGSMEFDPAKRAALFTEAMLAIDADAAFVPLITRNITWAMRDNVKVKARPNDIVDLRLVTLD
jgi:peptide/nickel transport system substrate-binding protein